MLLGLTGSIGSGKSLAACILSELGAATIDADELAREAVRPGSAALARITALFGADVLDAGGALKRQDLADRVFNEERARKELEDIVHPRVRELFEARVAALRNQAAPPRLIVYAAPLLFEAGYSRRDFDRILVVSAPRELCIERVMKRDGLRREAAERRYAAQLPIEQKEAMADIVIRNTGTPEELRSKLEKMYVQLTAGA